MECERESETVEIPLETLADMAFNLAPEVMKSDEYKTMIPDGGEADDLPYIYDLRDKYDFVETIIDTERGWGVVFGGELEFPVSYRVSRGSYWHPPEYDNDWYDLPWELGFFPGDNEGFGSAYFEVGL
ncbi:hypothetical protein [Halobellus limi]|uniref:Uncharacterized protein n=1 Tax=Halobellus limi TaxID=699433 RepID=A0A1H5ZF61_9EURY|nr:hypothetical protein [Halobellus limi]QCC48112.1 hypothetical protein DV707_10810 [Halobellus limi]SEG35119.1 hypothetical protein SAMN04488133_1979 [Halobellus limi]